MFMKCVHWYSRANDYNLRCTVYVCTWWNVLTITPRCFTSGVRTKTHIFFVLNIENKRNATFLIHTILLILTSFSFVEISSSNPCLSMLEVSLFSQLLVVLLPESCSFKVVTSFSARVALWKKHTMLKHNGFLY